MTTKAAHYDVIRKPISNEKSTMASRTRRRGHIEVGRKSRAKQPQIKEPVESAVRRSRSRRVNTTITKGKVKPVSGGARTRKDVKKAYVTLEEGNTIF